VITFM